MPNESTFDSFEKELNRLVDSFGKRLAGVLQNAVTATDRQIDALVYELYNLTPEEIQLVEGNT